MRYIVRCCNCDYIEEKDYITTTLCPKCNYGLNIEDLTEEDTIADDFEKGIKQNEIKDFHNITDLTLNRNGVYEIGKKDKEFYTLEEIVEMDLILSIEKTIKEVGHKRTWELIERIINPKQRIVFRKGFFKAGGRI